MLDEFIQEPGLSHARLPHDPDHVALALDSPVQQGVEHGHLTLPAYKPTQARSSLPAQGHAGPSAWIAWAPAAPAVLGWRPIHRLRCVPLHAPIVGVFTAEQHPRRGELLQPGHEMRHLPTTVAGCCGSLGLLPTMTGPVHTQAYLKRYLILRSGVLVGLMQAALQGEPGEHRTSGVILLGHRDTKQHQKAVVAGLESAMIRLDLVFDQVEQGLAQAWQRLKTQALDQGDGIRQGPRSTSPACVPP